MVTSGHHAVEPITAWHSDCPGAYAGTHRRLSCHSHCAHLTRRGRLGSLFNHHSLFNTRSLFFFGEQPLCRLCGPAALCPAENAQTRLAARKPPATHSDALGESVSRALSALAEAPFTHGNQVRALINGKHTFAAIFEAIARATEYVIVQFFVVRDDALGRKLKEALIERAAKGVRVYFLYDGIGSYDLPRHYIEALRAGGVEAREFATRRFINRFQLNFRNHRKIVIVDGKAAFVGGHNIGDEYLGAKPPLSPWRDTHIEVKGPAVIDVQFAFIEDWYWAAQRLPQVRQMAPEPAQTGAG